MAVIIRSLSDIEMVQLKEGEYITNNSVQLPREVQIYNQLCEKIPPEFRLGYITEVTKSTITVTCGRKSIGIMLSEYHPCLQRLVGRTFAYKSVHPPIAVGFESPVTKSIIAVTEKNILTNYECYLAEYTNNQLIVDKKIIDEDVKTLLSEIKKVHPQEITSMCIRPHQDGTWIRVNDITWTNNTKYDPKFAVLNM